MAILVKMTVNILLFIVIAHQVWSMECRVSVAVRDGVGWGPAGEARHGSGSDTTNTPSASAAPALTSPQTELVYIPIQNNLQK